MLHAYRLRAEYEGLHPETTISLPGGDDYKVGQAFASAKDGVVVLDDAKPEELAQAQTLAGYFAVKSTTVPESARKAAAKEQRPSSDQGAGAARTEG